MSAKRKVELSRDERERCLTVVNAGTRHARTITHARVLLNADSGPDGPGWSDQAIADAFGVSTVTVGHIRRSMVERGLDAALSHYDGSTREHHCKLDGRQEARVIAISRSSPPEGQKRWSLRMIANRMVLEGHVDSISHVTVGKVLKGGHCSLGVSGNGASPPRKTRSS